MVILYSDFLKRTEGDAKLLGFGPTAVVNGPFDTVARREFSRRVAPPLPVEDVRLKGAELAKDLAWSFDKEAGRCWLAPDYGVFLVVTNEQGAETVFGFFRFPVEIVNTSGQLLMEMPQGATWWSRNFVTSPDQRYRALVRRFARSGYLASEIDEYLK